MSGRRTWLLSGCIAAAVIGYYLSWYTHTTAGFTMNGFDLAEWTSLHPAVRASSPPLLTSFLLRMPQVMLAFALALAANGLTDNRMRWIMRALAVLLALRMIPPTEFFTETRDDPNYRQMALLTVLGLGFVLIAVLCERAHKQWQISLLAVVLITGAVMGWMGLSRTVELLNNFQIDTHTGPGIIGLTVFSLGVAGIALWPLVENRFGNQKGP